MSEAFLVSSSMLIAEAGQSRAELASRVLQAVLQDAGVAARRVQEIHWQVPPRSAAPAGPERTQEFDVDPLGPWLIQLTQRLGFAPHLSAFLWPAAPLLDHYVLQSSVRAIQSGERDLLLLGQFHYPSGELQQPDQAAGLLLASAAAVGRYNLAPRARLAGLMVNNAAQAGWLGAACGGLKALATRLQPHTPEAEEEAPDLPTPEQIHWLASRQPTDDSQAETTFPAAQWLVALPPAPAGEFFLLSSLVKALQDSRQQWGLLFSRGPQETGLFTLIERI